MADSFWILHQIFSKFQKLNIDENISKMLKTSELWVYLHQFLKIFNKMSKRETRSMTKNQIHPGFWPNIPKILHLKTCPKTSMWGCDSFSPDDLKENSHFARGHIRLQKQWQTRRLRSRPFVLNSVVMSSEAEGKCSLTFSVCSLQYSVIHLRNPVADNRPH